MSKGQHCLDGSPSSISQGAPACRGGPGHTEEGEGPVGTCQDAPFSGGMVDASAAASSSRSCRGAREGGLSGNSSPSSPDIPSDETDTTTSITTDSNNDASAVIRQAIGSTESRGSALPAAPGRVIVCPKTGLVYQLGDQIGAGSAAVVYKCVRLPSIPSSSGSHGSPAPPSSGLSEEHRLGSDDCDSAASLPSLIPASEARNCIVGKADRGPLSISPDFYISNLIPIGSDFAVKVIDLRGLRLRTDYERERKKLRREVSILSKLHHPCIVHLYHVVETEDNLFVIMELVKGGELFFKIIERSSLTEDQARYVLLQVLSALQCMHSKGVIHRDLKPENILISAEPSPGFFQVKVADFGLAKIVTRGLSEAKTFVGTPQYWAPEVIDSSLYRQSYGPEADLWSLGCVIYVMLAGAYPFDSRLGPIDVLIKNARYHFKYPKFQRVSEHAKDLIRGLLTVDPRRRLTISQTLDHPWLQSFCLPSGLPPIPVNALSSEDVAAPDVSDDGFYSPERLEAASSLPRHSLPGRGGSAMRRQNASGSSAGHSSVEGEAGKSSSSAGALVARRADELPSAGPPHGNAPVASAQEQHEILEAVGFAAPASDIARSGLVFDFEELLQLQIHIMRKIHWAYITLRQSPEATRWLQHALMVGQDVNQESIAVMQRLETTCLSVLEVLPDLSLAVTELQPQLAIDLFGDIRDWVSDLRQLIGNHQKNIAKFSRLVADLVERMKCLKLEFDMSIKEAHSSNSRYQQRSQKSEHFYDDPVTTARSPRPLPPPPPAPCIPRIRPQYMLPPAGTPPLSASRGSPTAPKMNLAGVDQASTSQGPSTAFHDVLGASSSLMRNARASNLSIESITSVPEDTTGTDRGGVGVAYSACALNASKEDAEDKRNDALPDFALQAYRTSAILADALEEIRRVGQILRQSAIFWLDSVTLLDRLCHMKTHTERLVKYSVLGNPQLTRRFFERLANYHAFWASLSERAHMYVAAAKSHMRAMTHFALALEDRGHEATDS